MGFDHRVHKYATIQRLATAGTYAWPGELSDREARLINFQLGHGCEEL